MSARPRLMRALALAAGCSVVGGGLAGCGDEPRSGAGRVASGPPVIAEIVPAEQMLAGAHVPSLDPGTMNDAELRVALPDGPLCTFKYTESGGPVFAVVAAIDPGTAPLAGVVKLNGRLVQLAATAPDPAAALLDGSAVAAGPIRLRVSPLAPQSPAGELREARLRFEVGRELLVHYRGFYGCVD